jgi:hypothetical protein
MAAFDAVVWPAADQVAEQLAEKPLPRVDVASRLRGLWS